MDADTLGCDKQPSAASTPQTATSYKIETYLPQVHGIPNEVRDGRNVFDGYTRGWGLQFTDLIEKVKSDPLYKDALSVSADRTLMSENNRVNIFLILRFFLQKIPFGHIVEYGSYRGGSALFMAYVAKHLFPSMKVYAMDTFAGMHETDKSLDAHNKGDFSDTDIESLIKRRDELKLNNLIVIQGLFEETNSQVMNSAGQVSLAHIDCDIASAVKFAYEGVKPYMCNGGYVVFDDANVSSCIGATDVVESIVIRRDGMNSEQIWPHFVFRTFIK